MINLVPSVSQVMRQWPMLIEMNLLQGPHWETYHNIQKCLIVPAFLPLTEEPRKPEEGLEVGQIENSCKISE